jgi:hypothetical protein
MFGVSRSQLLILGVAGLFVAACAAPIPVDNRIVALMPESAAKSTLERLLGPDWVRAPYVDKWGTCLPERVPISFRDIKQMTYNPTLVPGVNYLGRSASIILTGGSEACLV